MRWCQMKSDDLILHNSDVYGTPMFFHVHLAGLGIAFGGLSGQISMLMIYEDVLMWLWVAVNANCCNYAVIMQLPEKSLIIMIYMKICC